MAALKAAGAQVVVSFSVPAFTALLQLTSLKLQFKPQLVVSNVGSDPTTLGGLLASFGKRQEAQRAHQGIITDGYLPSLGDTSNSWIALFKKIHDQYIPKLPFDGNVAYGLAVGYTFVQAMFKAGRNPTRQDLVNAIQAGLPQGASVAPYAYSTTDHNGITGAYMAIIKNGALVPKGAVLVTDTSPTGAITPFTAPSQRLRPAGSRTMTGRRAPAALPVRPAGPAATRDPLSALMTSMRAAHRSQHGFARGSHRDCDREPQAGRGR